MKYTDYGFETGYSPDKEAYFGILYRYYGTGCAADVVRVYRYPDASQAAICYFDNWLCGMPDKLYLVAEGYPLDFVPYDSYSFTYDGENDAPAVIYEMDAAPVKSPECAVFESALEEEYKAWDATCY